MVFAWILSPLLLAALSLGCGLLLERLSGTPFPRALLLPAGLALVIAAALFPPVFESTAPLATPLVVVLAAAGYGLAWPQRRPKLDGWAAGVGVAAYAAFAAPVVLIGRSTFAGYIKLDDTATYLAMLDRFTGHGYSVSSLPTSTYEAVLHDSLATGYPMGSLMPLAVLHRILGTDAAWLWQPYLSFLAAMIALGLYALAEPLVRARPLRAVAAVAAASAALLYGYALWGGIKELAEAAMLVLIAALLPIFLKAPGRRAALPLAVAAAATVGAQSAGGAVWLLVPAAAVAAVLARRPDRRASLLAAGALVVATLALSIPTLAAASKWLHHSGAFTSGGELGNLYHALSWSQIFGIWPTGDFRVTPGHGLVTGLLIAVVVIAAVFGFWIAWQKRGFGLLAYALSALVGSSIFWVWGSPWIGGKALAIASPLFVAAALAAAGWAFDQGRRIEALIAVVVILFGVGWSDVDAYQQVLLAPNSRLTELEAIGKQFAGQGPALETDYDPYGARHFLRKLDAEGAAERRVRPVFLRTGGTLATGVSGDVDEFVLSDLLVYRTLVTRRSPAASRPPSIYRLVAEGRYYQVWQRPPTETPQILEHLSLGDRLHAAAVPRCADVLRLAKEAGSKGRLAAVKRPTNFAADLDGSTPDTSGPNGQSSHVRLLSGATSFAVRFDAPVAGFYEIGVDGSFRSRLDLFFGSTLIASTRHELNWPGEYEPLATVRLHAGENRLTLRYGGPDLHPGSTGTLSFGLGPLVIGRVEPDTLPVTFLRPTRARTLCGKSMDWIEAIAPAK